MYRPSVQAQYERREDLIPEDGRHGLVTVHRQRPGAIAIVDQIGGVGTIPLG
jgi:hypothetical protein